MLKKQNNKSLVVVDIQLDFCEGGILAAKDTPSIFEPLNNYIKEQENLGSMIVYSRDWHPKNHPSFKNQGGIWDNHCIAGSEGAAFHKKLYISDIAVLINKGRSHGGEGYSVFDHTSFDKFLRAHNITDLTFTGIAIEYCVKYSAIDAAKLGYKTTVIKNLTRGIGSEEDFNTTWLDLQKLGIACI